MAAVDSTGRGKTSQPAPPPPTALFIPALGEAWNTQMEGSTRTRSPHMQQMAAEGAVTRNRSKKDVGAAVVPTSRGQESKDNRSVRDGGGAGKDKGTEKVVAAKDKRARAKDDEGAPGENAQSKDNRCVWGAGAANNKGVRDGGGAGKKDKGVKGGVAAQRINARGQRRMRVLWGRKLPRINARKGEGNQQRSREENCPPRGIGLHLHRLMLGHWG